MGQRLRVLVVAAVLGLGGIIAFSSSGGAVVLSAADLAADCNDDGIVSLTEDTRYVGGSADITGVPWFGAPGCMVDLASEGVNVAFVNVYLRAKGGAFLNIGQSSVGRTSIKVRNSTIDMHPEPEPGGYLSIKTGCCAGEAFEQDTTVSIGNSQLRATWIELGASLAAPRGRFTLTGSTVQATGDAFVSVPDIILRVSSGGAGVDGRLSASRNLFAAPGGLEAVTGTSGRTSMIDNDFTGVGGGITVSTGAGGTCESVRNTPAAPCT